MDLTTIALLAISVPVLAVVLGSLFRHKRTRSVMNAVGSILQFLATLLR